MKYIFVILFLSAFFLSCNPNKLDCYNSELNIITESKNFDNLLETARKDLPFLKGERGQNLFNDTSYIYSATIDKVVFFNSDRSKCLLLVLQQTSKNLYLDQVLIIQGTFIDGKWTFKPDRLPAVPKVIYTVRKSGERQNPVNNSVENLSKKARLFILTAGTVNSLGCEIDKEYWFGNRR